MSHKFKPGLLHEQVTVSITRPDRPVWSLTTPGFVHTFFCGKDGTMPSKYDPETKTKAIRLVRSIATSTRPSGRR